ncbi:hypothetical protein [Paracoccus sp. ME4]|uniref:hypothetical protein n=1 Tax=Paracoccus sp. ME4 TaxID=3138066 RepID=UPI00398AE444
MAGSYRGGSTILRVAGATAGVVDEPRRGERIAVAFPAKDARGRDYGEPTQWASREVFRKFVQTVDATRAQTGLTERQVAILDGFLCRARELLRTRTRKWGERHGVAAARHVAELRSLWEQTRPG